MKSFHCTECGRLFSRKRNLPVHVDSVHKGKKPFECEKCGKFFTQKSNLKSHLKAVHESKKPYACEVCCKTFTQKSNLRSHLKAVHAVTPRGSLENASSAALTRTQPTASKPPLIALKQRVIGQRSSLVDKRGQALQEDTQKAQTL
ncbi:Gastrula zinc finger protein xFG20-1 [Taenia solium]|eukprot:TsM_000703100 transcript=TsM_000703100 gene=TsM_000703100